MAGIYYISLIIPAILDFRKQKMRKILLLILFLQGWIIGFAQETDTINSWQTDSIQIKKNWRTRDKIILRELQFNQGETIDKNCLNNSINQIWNIGNFAQVDYLLDTLANGNYWEPV